MPAVSSRLISAAEAPASWRSAMNARMFAVVMATCADVRRRTGASGVESYFRRRAKFFPVHRVLCDNVVRRLRKRHGGRRWRKLKGDATVRLANGSLRRAEVHWYEAHGVGKRGLKIKRFLD